MTSSVRSTGKGTRTTTWMVQRNLECLALRWQHDQAKTTLSVISARSGYPTDVELADFPQRFAGRFRCRRWWMWSPNSLAEVFSLAQRPSIDSDDRMLGPTFFFSIASKRLDILVANGVSSEQNFPQRAISYALGSVLRHQNHFSLNEVETGSRMPFSGSGTPLTTRNSERAASDCAGSKGARGGWQNLTCLSSTNSGATRYTSFTSCSSASLSLR